jgi:NADPH2:quinone reductase
MHAAWYEKQGPVREVLIVDKMPDPDPGPGKVRIRVAAPASTRAKSRSGKTPSATGCHTRASPHSNGAGEIERAGDGVSAVQLGERIWCYGA